MSNAGLTKEKGDVEATGTFTDNSLIRGDGEKRIQDSGITVDDSDNMTNITTIAVTDAPTTRTNLGLGTIATQASSAVSITGGSVTGITDLTVADGGTGASSAVDARANLGLDTGTAYAPLLGGTTVSGEMQSAAIGASGEVFTSGGAGVAPSFQAVDLGGYPSPKYDDSGTYPFLGYLTDPTLATNASISTKKLILVPIIFGQDITITKICINVTVAAAGSQARLGIYNSDSNGLPSTVLLDAATVATATTGEKSIAVSQAVTASTLYYAAYTVDLNGGAVSLRGFKPFNPFLQTSIFGMAYLYQATVDPASSLPDPFALTATSGSQQGSVYFYA